MNLWKSSVSIVASMNWSYKELVPGEGMRSVHGGVMCITGEGVVGSALAGTDRKNWFPLVEEIDVLELGL